MVRWVINLVAVYACWFACILGAAAGRPLLGPLAVAIHLALHLALAPRRGVEMILIVFAGIGGYLADSALVLTGLLGVPDAARWGGPSPVWMVALWLNFATTLNLTLGWLKDRPLSAAVLGALAGPATYYAGVRLGAVELPAEYAIALVAIGLEWLITLPFLSLLARTMTSSPVAKTEAIS